MAETILRVEGIHKRFGPTIALNDVCFTLRRGEVHGLVGENGSGKSTLSSIIAGIQQPDSGKMELLGQSYQPKNALEAQAGGVSMIVQEMGTASSISVAENIFLGNEGQFSSGGFIRKKAMIAAAQQALDTVGAGNLSAALPAGALDPEARKIVEIAKAMYAQPEVLIVDETTTALTQEGRELLYDCIKTMCSSNRAVILISHDLDEIQTVCSTLTVLRDGKIIGSLDKDEFSSKRIRAMLVGREVTGHLYREDYDGSCKKETVLRAEHVSGNWQINDVSFSLHRGEILGIGGLSSGGIHELGRLLFGIDRPRVGSVSLPDGTKITNPAIAVKHGVGYVSKDRDNEAIMLGASIRNNLVLPSLAQMAQKKHLIADKCEKELSQQLIEKMEIKCNSMEQMVQNLSGGNKQKVSFGKWIGCGAQLLILDCPTRGIDIGVKQVMYRLIYELKEQGFSFILISEELPELIGMSDQILILKDGGIAGEYPRSQTLTEHDL
ncbi:MAG: sugar ABC transporter ATP-binding protein, partial [Firmicutes bacterium]|nr:sugar ABC transporter ATP-binding protein [Bacillota bacterium]